MSMAEDFRAFDRDRKDRKALRRQEVEQALHLIVREASEITRRPVVAYPWPQCRVRASGNGFLVDWWYSTGSVAVMRPKHRTDLHVGNAEQFLTYLRRLCREVPL